ncbi:STAS domain-containing protein [Streptomyces sp. T-3]|nr:STAS domain-containing protein [Streptomyces sp. T-3]
MSTDELAYAMCEQVVGPATILELHGEIDIQAAVELAPKVTELIALRRPEVVVDLTAVTFLDPGGLRLLAGVRTRVAERGGTLWVVRGAAPVMKVIRLARLETAFAFLDGRPPALADGDRPPGADSVA